MESFPRFAIELGVGVGSINHAILCGRCGKVKKKPSMKVDGTQEVYICPTNEWGISGTWEHDIVQGVRKDRPTSAGSNSNDLNLAPQAKPPHPAKSTEG